MKDDPRMPWWWEFGQAEQAAFATVYCKWCQCHVGEVRHAYNNGEQWVNEVWRPFVNQHERDPAHRYNETLEKLSD